MPSPLRELAQPAAWRKDRNRSALLQVGALGKAVSLEVLFGLLWLQSCSLPYTLTHYDSLWQITPASLRWLAKQRTRFRMREVRSQLPVPAAFFTGDLTLLGLYKEGEDWVWCFRRGEDTLQLQSLPVPGRLMQRHFALWRGPRTWLPGAHPYKVIELLLPLAPRPQTPSDTLWTYNQRWLAEFAAPWALWEKPTQGRLSALSFTLHYYPNGAVRYQSIALLVAPSDRLPFDQKVAEKPIRKLPPPLHKRLSALLKEAEAYSYAVRIQDYYPPTLEEAYTWYHLLAQGTPFPLPAHLQIYPTPPIYRLPQEIP